MNIRLTKAQTLEIDPKKAYLLFLKRGAVNEEQAKELGTKLHEIGMDNVVVALVDKGSHKIVEVGLVEKKEAKKAVKAKK